MFDLISLLNTVTYLDINKVNSYLYPVLNGLTSGFPRIEHSKKLVNL